MKKGVAVITGATRGIGRAMAVLFAKNNYDVVCIYKSSSLDVEELLRELAEYSDNSSAYACDVSDFEECKKVFEMIYDKYINVDVLINNAGITADVPFIFMEPKDFSDVIDVNLFGAFNCTKQVIKPMVKRKYGRIINISSIAGIYGNAGQSNYSCSKGALVSFTKSLVKEYASYGITFNCISPGFIDTGMTNSLSDMRKNNYIELIPSKRAGVADDVANLALFLASENASYINGENISVSGGLVI